MFIDCSNDILWIIAAREQRIIELALEHWHNITCLNFVRKNDAAHGNRIVFTDVDGCASNVGRHPLGEPQFVSLAPECMRVSSNEGQEFRRGKQNDQLLILYSGCRNDSPRRVEIGLPD